VTRQGIALGALALVAVWAYMSFYSVRPEERSVELFLGESAGVGNPGLNFAPWPLVTFEKVQVTGERTTEIGQGEGESGLMLTRDQNIVDIGFQVVWNIADPEKYLFNLADPEDTMRAVSESAMRDIVARSELSPILNRDRGVIAADVQSAVQQTLDSYNAGIQVIRVNLQRAQPPGEVLDAFREVQAAQQQRDTLESEADAYANRVTAGARGAAAQFLEEAEAYRAQAVNSAQGEAARFVSVYNEYVNAPEVTRRRLYIETMERVFGDINKVILDGVSGGEAAGQGVVPFLPLNELGRLSTPQATTKGLRARREGPTDAPDVLAIAPVVVLLIVGLSSVFIVDERKKALVLQFGQVTQVREEPGLGFKLPFIQEVVFYEDRILGLPTTPIEVTMLDDRRLVVDAFARWRITDLVRFREAVGTGAEAQALRRLDGIINPAIQEVLGSVPSNRVCPKTGPG
jgi:modulator of FtsH protease HflK